MISKEQFDSILRAAQGRELTAKEDFEVVLAASPELRSMYAEFGVTDYESYLRVQSQMEMRMKLAGIKQFDPVTAPKVDPDEWMTEALKRSAAVEAELRSTSGHGGF
jgi:hypothetical protein